MKNKLTKWTLLCAALAAGLGLSACLEQPVDGTDGAAGAECSATAIADTAGNALGYAFVCSDSSGTVSEDTVWNGTDGRIGSDCSAKAAVNKNKDTSYVLVCAGDTVATLANGSDGADGTGCTATPLSGGSGYTLVCGDSEFTVLNGKNGADGTGCTVSDTATSAGVSGYKITCADTLAGIVWNGVSGKAGTDGVGCTTTSAGDSIVQVCGKDTVVTYKAWCGGVHYDPAKRFCSVVTLYDLCGGKSYDPAKQYCLATDIGTGVQALLTDARDKQVYKTVKIGAQTWMAQNLNYADSLAMPNLKGNSWCYENSADSCAKFGRLYTWTAAMDIAGSYQTALAGAEIQTTQQGVCPAGWHVPTDAEWNTLATAVGGADSAGVKLKSADGWRENGSGTDDYGFSALPAGYRDIDEFSPAGIHANFWSTAEDDANYAYYRDLYFFNANMDTGTGPKYRAYSVRCVQD